jgi:hypothetical protein
MKRQDQEKTRPRPTLVEAPSGLHLASCSETKEIFKSDSARILSKLKIENSQGIER